ncbi:MAG: sigma-70 family RNA polymerase sigma factor [Phycisphaerae bacterium]|nr:sigma-70 family RNA polymerase sigma factor [Phycisphaerae bacterium]
MAPTPVLQAILSRACDANDAHAREAAFAELLRLVSIFVRAGMGDRLRDHRESIDVCQSVAKSFVEDFSGGRLSFPNEAALASYLQRVVRSKLAELGRRDATAKRGGGARQQMTDSLGSAGGIHPHADTTSASDEAEIAELLHRIRDQLTPFDREIIHMRRQGLEWGIIARQLGKDSASLRQHWARLQKRISDQLE